MSDARRRNGPPWYLTFFGEDFWAVADHEYAPERTAAETDYLAAVLGASAPGRRVLDLGCGTGRHAVALAAREFSVTGVDAGGWALERAEAAAKAAGVRADWLRLDLLRELPWPIGEFDAVVCVQSFGWGSDAQQLRLLQEVRRVLVPGGLLILDHSNVLAIAGNYVPEATFETEGLRADFRRAYRVASGRSTGEIEVRRGDAEPVVIHDDVRMYQPAEVHDLLTRAGFTVERVDADFAVGREPAPTTRYVQFVARSRASTAAAITVWKGTREETRPSTLDLRWSPDEIEFVRPWVDAAFRGAYDDGGLAELSRAYPLSDPYSADLAAPVLSGHFGLDLAPGTVTAGAGATGLLHACAALALPGPVLHLAGGHPDLPRWAARLGAGTITTRFEDLTADLDRHTPSVLVLDRPTITGDLFGRERLAEIAEAARACGTTVVLDEAYAVYAGPGASCVPAVAEHPNLIVLRSMSKGYCCGGLRVGFAFAAPESTQRLREIAPPLGAGGAGLAVALRLLAQGDVFGALRTRIAEVKPVVARTLRQTGLKVTEGADCLPWVTVEGERDANLVWEGHGVRVKEIGAGEAGFGGRPGEVAGVGRRDSPLYKIAVPLSEDRLTAFRDAFADAG
ncbi:aminotransferase class I/II-fold pyridoxal phosphate-dependent enzyme [Streptomyces sp. NBC_00151]|uniref:aminotransferase class I/II-fold pyridoxal phosphate-dependent enzyme n=1 Tax=Streptomyces sp. NBC_00151 TaxID=2975669 RepID=UPI002DD89211|nr:aminotransferase class I/II-fold pyridoxal phosphate-dependent enzyme [Streptomyces sp. NBC_00151]WRZ44183.1 aminotransferase class I/II-fold pyridoxal phosphate-dependent enzyme [Streptomyces sp. NBC_00151]